MASAAAVPVQKLLFRNLPGPSLAVTVPGFSKIFQAASTDAPQVILWGPRERKRLLALPKTEVKT